MGCGRVQQIFAPRLHSYVLQPTPFYYYYFLFFFFEKHRLLLRHKSTKLVHNFDMACYIVRNNNYNKEYYLLFSHHLISPG